MVGCQVFLIAHLNNFTYTHTHIHLDTRVYLKKMREQEHTDVHTIIFYIGKLAPTTWQTDGHTYIHTCIQLNIYNNDQKLRCLRFFSCRHTYKQWESEREHELTKFNIQQLSLLLVVLHTNTMSLNHHHHYYIHNDVVEVTLEVRCCCQRRQMKRKKNCLRRKRL